jgi:hypothetical protein
VLAELIIAPYILMFSARFTALIYRGWFFIFRVAI